MKNERRDGYHKTEVGWIPTGWSCDRLLEHTSKIGSGVTPTGGEAVYESHGIPFIRSQNILIGEFTKKGLAYIPSDVHDEMQNSKVIPGDVLYNITGASIGRCCLFPKDLKEANVNQHVCIIRPTRELTAEFLMQVLNSSFGERQLYQSQAGGGRQGLNYKNFGAFYIPFPSFDEQQKISKILSTWDRAIVQVQRLIEAKQRQKKGLMQGLLTGRFRFPEFGKPIEELGNIPDGWKAVEFHDFATRSTKKIDPVTNDLNFRCIELEHISQKSGKIIGETESKQQTSPKNFFRPGNVLFGKLRPYLHKFAFCEFKGVCSSEIWVFQNKSNCTSRYLFYLVQTDTFSSASIQTTGTKMPRSDWNVVRKTKFVLPTLHEQERIAALLDQVEQNIDLLERYIMRLNQLKKGLMQKLLTGEIRVKVD